jgi:hypothetical protein
LSNIILSLCLTIQIQLKIIYYLMWIILGKYSLKKFYDEPVSKEYRKLQVDSMPVVESFERLDYIQLLNEYLSEHGKPLKPISRHKGVFRFLKTLSALSVVPHIPIYTGTMAKLKIFNTFAKCVTSLLATIPTT